MLKKIYTIFYVSLIPFSLWAQPDDTGNWLILFGNKKISSKWNWHHEIQYRNYNFAGDLEQLLIRTGIGYNLTENNNNLLAGYGYVLSEPYVSQTDEKIQVTEHRIYEQYITRQQFGRIGLLHRYRFEQRFVESDFRMRLRYFLSLQIALTRPTVTDKTWYLSGYNEIFLNTQSNIFDRNRLYGGIGYRFSETVRTELGFMNQSTSSVSRNQLQMIAFINY